MSSSVPSGSLNISHFYQQQNVSAYHFPFHESFSLVNTESKWVYNFPTRQKPRYEFNRKWVTFHFFCAMLYLCTTLSLSIDCNVSVFLTVCQHLPPFRWAMTVLEVLIAIPTICNLACMLATQLTLWFHASLSLACTFLFVFSNCKIYLWLWCILINLYSDCMFTTEPDSTVSHFLDRSLGSSLYLEHQPSSQQL